MASYVSAQDGEWHDPNTWGGGGYPDTDADTATLTHTVTYSISADIELGEVNLNSGGTLSFSPTANTRIQFGDAHLIVADEGTLSVGTSADVIQKEYTAEIVWNTTTEATYGPNIQNGATLNVYGDPNYFGNTIDTALLSAGDGTTIILTEDDMSAKWNIGDEIIIGKGDVYGSWPTDALHTTIVGLSGTSMECADAVSSDFKSGGWIVHLTRNVEFYKLGYDRSPRAGNSLRPRFWAGTGTPIMNVSNCSIASFRRMQYFRGTFNNIVIRNTTDGLYYPYGGSYYNCIWYSSYRAFYVGVRPHYIEGGYFVLNDGEAFRDCEHIHAKNFRTFATLGLGYAARDSFFEDCLVGPGTRYGAYGFQRCVFWNTHFYGNQYALYYNSWDCRYINCNIGFDANDNEFANVYDMRFYAIHSKFISCKLPDNPALWQQNVQWQYATYKFENWNRIADSHRMYHSYANSIKVDADGGGSRPNQRSGGGSAISEVETLSNIGYGFPYANVLSYIEPLGENKIWLQSNSTYNIKYYVQTDYTSLNSSELYLEVWYMGSSLDATISKEQSTNTVSTRSNQSDWSQYVEISITPLQTGWARLFVRVNKYEAGKYIWIDPEPEVI